MTQRGLALVSQDSLSMKVGDTTSLTGELKAVQMPRRLCVSSQCRHRRDCRDIERHRGCGRRYNKLAIRNVTIAKDGTYKSFSAAPSTPARPRGRSSSSTTLTRPPPLPHMNSPSTLVRFLMSTSQLAHCWVTERNLVPLSTESPMPWTPSP